VITADEGDHFVGGPPSPANCNGVQILCTYKTVGEVDGNLTGMLAAKGVAAPFDVQADSAPIVYVHGQPGRTSASVRTLERTAATLTASDLATGKTVPLINYQADPVEMKLLHMITGDPRRTATDALFANPDFWLDSSLPSSCARTALVCEPSGGDAWNHGDVAPEINTTWLGLAGPDVQRQGVNNWLWSDHTDIQPTMMELLSDQARQLQGRGRRPAEGRAVRRGVRRRAVAGRRGRGHVRQAGQRRQRPARPGVRASRLADAAVRGAAWRPGPPAGPWPGPEVIPVSRRR
jgi:hypothetical protein